MENSQQLKEGKAKLRIKAKIKEMLMTVRVFPFFYVFNFVLLIKMRNPEKIYLDDL